ncbi:integral membrane protein GPR137 [Lepisosteus oculatus]|uniref:integral membrane protein GPR137 n=1 Tax=Lepisosteus oculatus TaxID=7918 RepID=UPI0035F50FD8
MDPRAAPENASRPDPTPWPLRPAVPPSVQLGLTAAYAALYGALFLLAYAQLWLLLVSGHKRWSYQSAFLFLCLLWAGLRATLFSFYFRDTPAANRLPPPAYWLLYCCPVCLQFFTLSLINLYFSQVVLKMREKFRSEPSRGLALARLAYGGASAVFLSVNVACALLGERGGEGWRLVLVRVLVNDSLFILEAIALAGCLLILTRLAPSTSLYLQGQGTTVCHTVVLGVGVIVLFSSRACYNLAVLVLSQSHKVESFDYDWYNISDQADLRSEMGDWGYLVFGAILFIWELLPTALLIAIFRVRRPPRDTGSSVAIGTRGPRSYFFDDPQGGESDPGGPWGHGTAQPNSWYQSSESSWFGSGETAPLLFARDIQQTNQHHSLYSTPQN